MAAAAADSQGNFSVNRAKKWQIALFPFNNAATNTYFAFYSYFVYWAVLYLTGSTSGAIAGVLISGSLAIAVSTFASLFAPLMRVFDGVTDPILGGMMDRTKTRFGKFRPFMVIGNVLLAISIILMMLVSRLIPSSLAVLQWADYIVSYIIFIIGYTCQCAVTKAGQTCLTNDPKQRSQFLIWNMVGTIGSVVLINLMANGVLTNESICAKGLIVYESESGSLISDIIAELSQSSSNATLIEKLTALNLDPNTLYAYNYGAAYGTAFYNIMVPFVIIVSGIYTTMAVAAISSKDKPEYWGVGESNAKFKDYMKILKENKEIRWLVLSSGFNKLATTVSTSGAVAFLLYGCLMGDYNGLYIPFYALCFIFMALFFVWGTKTAGKKGQKRGVTQFTILAFLFYIGVLVLLCIYDSENAATMLSLYSTEGGFHLTVNAYTILFIIFYGCGFGAYNCCDNLTIPMVADCTDYETYRSGRYVPGIMGTLFSLVDKLISSLQTLLLQVFIVFLVPGLNALPTENTPYMEGMQLSAIICFCLLPMLAWVITTFCMTRYSLSGSRLREIQAVNSVRKAAVLGGMSMDKAMETWTTIDQVPKMFVLEEKKADGKKENILDRLYNRFFTKREKAYSSAPSSNAIEIPEEYRTEGVRQAMAAAEETSGAGAAETENPASGTSDPDDSSGGGEKL